MSNWNFDETPYPGPAFEPVSQPVLPSLKKHTFPIAGQITMTMPTHLGSVPQLFKPGEIYFDGGRPLGIIESVDMVDQTFTIRPQGAYFR